MKQLLVGLAALLALFVANATAQQVDSNPAMTTPDAFAWKMFVQVNTLTGDGHAQFETWASDTDTFALQPSFPQAASPLQLRRAIVPNLGRLAALRAGRVATQLPPGIANGNTEETRRNRAAFDFIVQNNLYKISGLKAAFGKTLVFPTDAIEIKANWVPVEQIPTFTNNRVSPVDVSKFYHVSADASGHRYALVAMHIITKAVPNWTWATFENEFNPARCDILGCHDLFGAPAAVPSNAQANHGYPPCVVTLALKAMFAAAKLDPVFSHYCLKGSQTDFTDNTGLGIRLGNSVAESGFVDKASCMTCHSRAVFGANGRPNTVFGPDAQGFPLGPVQPSWAWTVSAKPPIVQGMPGLAQLMTPADFVWSIPFCAVDDTVSPPRLNRNCVGK